MPNTKGQPGNIWTGTLSSNSVFSTATTVDIAAFRGPEDPHLFHDMHGSNGASLTMSAEGQTDYRASDNGAFQLGFGIRGTMNDPGTFVGNLVGVLFY